MAIVGQRKYTREREILRRSDAKGAPKIQKFSAPPFVVTRLLAGGDFRVRAYISPELPKLETTCSLSRICHRYTLVFNWRKVCRSSVSW